MSRTDKIEKVQKMLSVAKESLNSVDESEEVRYFDREAYLSEFDRVCEEFDVGVELEEDRDRDEVFSEWNELTNMSASDLKEWSKNPCSREASVDPVAVMKRNLRLLEKNKDEWTSNDYDDAERTISFINRMRGQRPDSPRKGTHGCPSEWAISLLNWAHNPFDSVPTPSSEVKEDLEPVEEVNLSSTLQDSERRNIKEAEMLAEQVWVMKDVLEKFNQEFQDIAMSLEEEKDIEEVRNVREQVVNNIDLMMTELESPVETVKGNPVEELQEGVSFEYEFEPVPNQVLYESREMAEERAGDIGLEGVHVHPVIFREPAEIPDELMDDVTVYHMAGETHGDWVDAVKESEEMSDERKASEVFHSKQQERKNSDDDDGSVRVSPVSIHRVEGGQNVEVSDDVENVLDRLWEDDE